LAAAEVTAARRPSALRWQFELDDFAHSQRWLESPDHSPTGIAVGPEEARRLHEVFLDTTDHRLEATGYTLRIRLLGDAAEAALVSARADAAGTGEHDELCERLPDTAFAAPASAPGPVGQRLRALCDQRPLAVLYEKRTHRRRYVLEADTREIGELVLDEVEVLGQDARPLTRRSTIAVTAEAAAASEVAAFLGALRAADGAGNPAARVESRPVAPRRTTAANGGDLTSHPTTVGAFVAAHLRSKRRDLGAWEFGARLGEDGEALQQMRATTCRLRAVLGLFASQLPSAAVAVRAELGWLADVLGRLRDLDLQLARLEEWRPTLPGDAAFEVTQEDLVPLGTLLAAERDVAQARMIEAFDSCRYRALLNDLISLAEQCEDSATPPILAVAPGLIRRRYRRVRGASRRLRGGAPLSDLHALRIHAKRLGYATELLAGEYGRPARSLARDARRLQEELTPHRDAAIALERLWRLGRAADSGLPPATVFAMGLLAERHRIEAARLPLPEATRRFGRKSWPRLSRRMSRRRVRVGSIPMPVVLEAHALGPGVAEVPGLEAQAVVTAAIQRVESAGIGPLAAHAELALPSIDAASDHPSAVRRLVSGMFSFLG